MTKTAALVRLRWRIIEDLCLARWHDVWFFPTWKDYGVKGWQGTAPIMFVGANPSAGYFPSGADHLFYRSLAKYGFRNAHLTDAFKVRATAQETARMQGDRLLVRLHRRYLLEEVKILRPHLVVALGRATYTLLQAWLPEAWRPSLRYMRHYSWAHRYRQEARWAREMASLARSAR